MKPVLLLSAFTAGLGVIRGLARQGVPVVVLQYDRRDVGQVARGVVEVVRVPSPDGAEEGVLDRIRPLAARYPGSLVMAGSDSGVSFLARYRPALEGWGFVVAAADEATVTTLLDKNETAALAESAGVPMPRTVELHDESSIERFTASARFPAILKPAISHRYHQVFGCKWTMVEDVDAAAREYRAAREHGFDVSLQEFIPGDEGCGANYIAYHAAGHEPVEFTARKVRNSPVESGSPSVTRSEWIPDLLKPGRRILEAAGYEGFACVEFKQDPRDGVYRLIEVNARYNLSGMLALHCGINFPWLQYRHLVLGQAPEAVPAAREGVYWIDITRDLKDARGYLGRPGYSLGRFLAPYREAHVFAVLSARDPRPALTRAVDTLRVLATGRRHGNYYPDPATAERP